MSRIVYAKNLKKNLGSLTQETRKKTMAALAICNIVLLLAVGLSIKLDVVWSILPSAKAYSLQSSPQIEDQTTTPRSEPRPPVEKAQTEPLPEQAQKAALFISSNYRIAKEAAEIITRETYKAGEESKVDPILMLAVIAAESRFNPLSESGAGALGLTQAMPEAHPEKIQAINREQGHVLNISDNIRLGTKILGEYMRKFDNNSILALQQYNGSLNDKNRVYSKKVLELRAKILKACS